MGCFCRKTHFFDLCNTGPLLVNKWQMESMIPVIALTAVALLSFIVIYLRWAKKIDK